MNQKNVTSYEEAFKSSKEYFGGDELAATTYLGKYALKNEKLEILEPTPDLMHRRLAKEFARIESKYPNPMSEDEIFALFDKFKYVIPQGSPMAGIGNPFQTMSISNCFVIPAPFDSMSGIKYATTEESEIMKRRGGVGLDISTIRPKGMKTSNAAGTTDGIEVFMEDFSDTCRRTAQNGRRGALLLSISVHHPEIRTFVNIKKDLKKVTGANISIRISDEFMNAVKSNEKVQLRFPVDEKETPAVSEFIDANALWNEIVSAAHDFAEPGLLFWDNVLNWCPTTSYPKFKSTSTNPCFAGDTLVATADGRNAVSIKQLAEEGKDVAVYSVDPKSGMVSIKMGRNPRITGHNQKLVRVILDDESYFDVTPNHKCLLRDGTDIEAKDLKMGMSLSRFDKEKQPVKTENQDYWTVFTNAKDINKNHVFEHRLIAKFANPKKWEEIYKLAKQSGWTKTGGLIVHHKDYNGLNNSPDNLEIMTFREHQQFHANHDNKAENNSHYSGFTNEQIKEHAICLTKQLQRRFSTEEWEPYAKQRGLPVAFSPWRQQTFKSVVELSKICAIELGYENIDCDPRLVKTLSSMLEQGYQANLIGNQVFVEKTCETCKNTFSIQHDKREISFCSHACSLVYVNSNKEIAAKRTESRNKVAQENATKNRQEQARIYSSLKFVLKRTPMQKEWETACKAENIPSRVGKVLKYGFQTWKEVIEAGDNYNHKVVSVTELEGEHTVYNITVDDNHTLAIITSQTGKRLSGVSVRNCGEITLSPYDSCRLLLTNICSFINNPFTTQANFDWEKFKSVAKKSQRLMDDVVDLELECVDRIINKINRDPEPDHVKFIEKNLWTKIREACVEGRRTGLGVTAIGDAVASLNMTYGSAESIEFVEELYKTLCLSSYKESINLAKERGAFPAFSHKAEADNLFINRVLEEDAELKAEYLKYGRRNIANLTTAPAGSVSICTQTTSGIEPAFMVSYKRRKKINQNDKNATVDFVDQLGDKWQEYRVFHHKFLEWAKINGKLSMLTTDEGTEQAIKESPFHKATSNDIDWVSKVTLQSKAQKWIDHSISNTTNIPNETPLSVTKDIYMTAWETGCKGVTVYRDGSRSGVLVSNDAPKQGNKDKFDENHAPKRPKELMCDVYQSTVDGEKWTIFVSLMDNKPYEVMGGLAKHIKLPKKTKTGKIIKAVEEDGTSKYNFHYDFENPDNETIIQDIGNIFENQTNAAFSRVISLSLRHGTPVQYVVEQLLKGSDKDSDLFSFSKVMSRVLKPYIKDGTKPTQKKCTNCNSSDLIYKEGCSQCLSCGDSKCG